ncbi:MAG: NAD-dependent epimerase/dehydratase family protein [Solirubrobacteraceae bacterium]
MNALVTGGAGFIGSHVVEALLARGARVAVVDDLSTGRRENLDGALAAGANLYEADIRDADATRPIVAHERPDAVFHLAAQIDVRRSVESPALDARVNVEGTINLLDAALGAGARRFLYASTGGAIYGEAGRVPTPEDAPVTPLSPYGQGKLAAEGYCMLFERLHGLSIAALRFANVYGPRQDPLGEGGVIAIFCGRAASGGSATVFGDGHQTRDFVYVSDVVDSLLAAADGDARGAFNVGTGRETSVIELAGALREVSGAELPLEHEPARPGEVVRSCLDASLARRALGWKARVGLAEGLERTLAAVS